MHGRIVDDIFMIDVSELCYSDNRVWFLELTDELYFRIFGNIGRLAPLVAMSEKRIHILFFNVPGPSQYGPFGKPVCWAMDE